MLSNICTVAIDLFPPYIFAWIFSPARRDFKIGFKKKI
jgi:hypothetical protein